VRYAYNCGVDGEEPIMQVCSVCDGIIDSCAGWLHSVKRGARYERVLTCSALGCRKRVSPL